MSRHGREEVRDGRQLRGDGNIDVIIVLHRVDTPVPVENGLERRIDIAQVLDSANGHASGAEPHNERER